MRMLLIAGIFTVGLCGCETKPSNNPPAKPGDTSERPDPKIGAALEKLEAKDRDLALAQKYCPVTKELLGSMGPPEKLTIKGQTVFVCCKSCNKEAETKADETLAKVAAFKAGKKE